MKVALNKISFSIFALLLSCSSDADDSDDYWIKYIDSSPEEHLVIIQHSGNARVYKNRQSHDFKLDQKQLDFYKKATLSDNLERYKKESVMNNYESIQTVSLYVKNNESTRHSFVFDESEDSEEIKVIILSFEKIIDDF